MNAIEQQCQHDPGFASRELIEPQGTPVVFPLRLCAFACQHYKTPESWRRMFVAWSRPHFPPIPCFAPWTDVLAHRVAEDRRSRHQTRKRFGTTELP